jgi:hypothetical protein
MSHYAEVKDGIVQQVIVAEQDFINILPNPQDWVQTSYNTHGNQHSNGGTPLRGNFAGIGDIYDSTNDVFYSIQPYPSWSLNTSTWLWEAPVPCPTDGKVYYWDESELMWLEFIES